MPSVSNNCVVDAAGPLNLKLLYSELIFHPARILVPKLVIEVAAVKLSPLTIAIVDPPIKNLATTLGCPVLSVIVVMLNPDSPWASV